MERPNKRGGIRRAKSRARLLQAFHAPGTGARTIEQMTLQRMEHVGIVVDDLADATELFAELGLVFGTSAPAKIPPAGMPRLVNPT